MGFFHFDESIQQRAGFIIGAFVYSEGDLTPAVFGALAGVGLRAGIDEFKSGARMEGRPGQTDAREALRGLLTTVRIGLVVAPTEARADLGNVALAGLEKIIRANGLTRSGHGVYFDEGIAVDADRIRNLDDRVGVRCETFVGQDSRSVGGIQLADLAAHSLGIMLLEEQGYLNKTVKAGEGSGYDPELDIEIGFELWASLRYAFFRAARPKSGLGDALGDQTFDVASYGLYVAPSCDDALRTSAVRRFGECYLGCIH